MNRLLLIVLGGPLIFLALVQIAIWIGEPGAGRLASTATPTTGFPALTRRALQRYHGLSPVEQRGLRDRLHAAMWTPARWREAIQPQFSLLCLGEQHSGPLRARLHEAVLGGLDFDLLALETDAAGLTAIRLALDQSAPIELLEAPIDRLLRPLLRRPRPPRLVAIDESAAQRERRRQGLTTREASLVGNLARAADHHQRVVVLIGGLHCARDGDWFLGRLAANWKPPPGRRVIGTRVVLEGSDSSVQTLLDFFDAIDLERRDFVLESERVGYWARSWFPLLKQQIFDHYDALIVLRQAGRGVVGRNRERPGGV